MGSDRARLSYAPRQDYRAVVMQQGRVTVEADWNEQQQIASEDLREETLDFVGPAGTPDDGYRIIETGTAPTPPFDFSVGAGTMYVGGVRAKLGAAVDYNDQHEWLDHIGDPDWVDLPTQRQPPGDELVYLYLREQEVSAVEDHALREIALGGPDTAARLRLIQHIVRLRTSAADCAAALADAGAKWASEGLTFAPATMRLLSTATLRVTFPPLPPAEPCEPAAPDGFLGADNQLIRIQISGPNRFLWGYDNACFLYRVKVKNATTLHLESRPPDAFHQPRAGQAVEVLCAAAKLDNGEYVAEASGFVTTLTAPYNPDTQEVALAGSPPPDKYGDGTAAHPSPPRVFVRVWEQEITFTPGSMVDLGNTGLRVTLNTGGDGPFHVGDYWLVAVRPSEPRQVYPERYLHSPQPPDGPRLWACPLGVIRWTNGILKVIDDCRKHFCNLIDACKEGGGCCTVNISPEDLTGDKTLQKEIDRLANRGQVTLCLAPGIYQLPKPLLIGPQHSNLTIEACHDGAVLQAAPGAEQNFLQGLMILDRANNVTIRRLRFDLPQVPFAAAGGKLSTFDQANSQIAAALTEELFVSVGLRPVHCALLTVEDCLFRFTITKNRDCFGAGIFAASECWGLKLLRNRFVREEDYLQVKQRPFRILVGYLLAPSASPRTARGAAASERRVAAGALVRALLQDAVFEDNLFSGLTVCALVYGNTGSVTIEGNTVRECLAGFWLFSLRSIAYAGLINRVAIADEDQAFAAVIYQSLLAVFLSPAIQIGSVIARSYPLPEQVDLSHTIQIAGRRVPSAAKDQVLIQNVFDRLTPLFRRSKWATEGTQAPAPPAPPPPPAPPATSKKKTMITVSETPQAEEARAEIERVQALSTDLMPYRELNLHLSTFERQALVTVPEHGFAFSLHASGNDIELLVRNVDSGLAFLAWDDERDTRSSATMSANKIRNESLLIPSALLLMVERCAVSGNVILNENLKGSTRKRPIPSLVLLPGSETPSTGGEPIAPAAVTGNVFRGRALLPPRPALTPPAPPPMDTWDFFNTEL